MKKLQRVRIRTQKFGTRLFWSETFWHVSWNKSVSIRKITFLFVLLHENDIFCIFRAYSESMVSNKCFQNVSDFELKKTTRQLSIYKICTVSDFEMKKKHQISNLNFYIGSDFKLKFFYPARFVKYSCLNVSDCQKKVFSSSQISMKNFPFPLMWNSNPVLSHVSFTTSSSIQTRTITVYKIFVNWIIAFITVQTIFFVVIFARTLTIDFAMAPHFFVS